MKNFIKTYIIGILTIAMIIQPWFFGKLIGLNMTCTGCAGSGYIWAVCFEVFIILSLIAPFLIGYKIKELFKKDNK